MALQLSLIMRVSLRHVAEHAGVSRVTASNVLRGRAGEVSPATRERVMEAVRQLEYIPVTPPTRQGVHTPTRIIGLFYDGIKLDEYWDAVTARGLHQAAIDHDYDLLTILRAAGQGVLNDEELRFLDRRSDGFIFLTPSGREEILRSLVQHEIPVVTAFTDQKIEGVSTVVLDNAGAMQLAVAHLRQAGHTKLAYVTGMLHRSDFQARHQSFKSEDKKAPCFDVAELDWMEQLLDSVERGNVTGVVCATDYFALELYGAARSRKMKVPRDFSLVGMDNIPQIHKLGLTTISYSPAEVGRKAVQAIVGRLAGDDARSCNVVLPVTLLQRGSVAPPK